MWMLRKFVRPWSSNVTQSFKAFHLEIFEIDVALKIERVEVFDLDGRQQLDRSCRFARPWRSRRARRRSSPQYAAETRRETRESRHECRS